MPSASNAPGKWIENIFGVSSKHLPGVTGFATLTLAILEVFLAGRLSTASQHALLVIVSALVALVLVPLGDVWDGLIFDPLYSEDNVHGIQGRMLSTAHTRLLIFPAGERLFHARRAAAQDLPPARNDAEGLYARARRALEEQQRWDEIFGLLQLSKFFRGMILPSAVGCLVCFSLGVASLLQGTGTSRWWMWAGIFAVTSLAAMSAYIRYRVNHLVEVYEMIPRTSSPSETATRALGADPTQADDSIPAELRIAYHGEFVGGDYKQATDLVLAMECLPPEVRRVRVDADPLHDAHFRRKNPDSYAKLKRGVERYEDALQKYFRGVVSYQNVPVSLEWSIEAVLELRALTLQGARDDERWWVWPPTEEPPIPFYVSDKDAAHIRSGYYERRTVPGGQEGIEGLPGDRPVSVRYLTPELVWTRIVPAVLVHLLGRSNIDRLYPVSVTSEWVFSDRQLASWSDLNLSQ